MESTIEILQKLHGSVQKLESVLQEVWGHIDELGDDDQYNNLMKKAKQYKKKKQPSDESMEELSVRFEEFDNRMDEIPEDGTAAIDFEDSISELIEWMKNNK